MNTDKTKLITKDQFFRNLERDIVENAIKEIQNCLLKNDCAININNSITLIINGSFSENNRNDIRLRCRESGWLNVDFKRIPKDRISSKEYTEITLT